MAKELEKCPHCGAMQKLTEEERMKFNVTFVATFIIRSVLVFIFIILINGCDSNTPSDHVDIGTTYTTKVRCYGTFNKEDLNRVRDILEQKDNAAFREMQYSGRFFDIPEGTSVTVEDTWLTGQAKVRVRGQANSSYIFSVWLQ